MSEQEMFDSIEAHSAQAQTYGFRIPYLPKLFEQVAERSSITKEREVLDLCCGNGQLAVGFSKYAAHINAVDGSAEMLNLAPKANNVRYIQSDVNNPQLLSTLSGKKFDHFVVGRAIHWIKAESLRALSAKCLRDDGCIIVAAAGWGRETPWLTEFLRVRDAYGSIPRLDWSGEDKMSRIGFHIHDRIIVTVKTSCSFEYLVNHASSYSTSYQAIRSSPNKFKSDLAHALKKYVVDQVLVGQIESAATVFRR